MSTRRRRSLKGAPKSKQERMERPPSGKAPKSGETKSTRRRRC